MSKVDKIDFAIFTNCYMTRLSLQNILFSILQTEEIEKTP